MQTPPFHVVKEAAVTDALRRFGALGIAGAKKLFQPMELKASGPGMFQSGYHAWKNRSVPGTGAVVPEALKGLWRTSKSVGKHVGEFAREATFGSPTVVAKQLAENYRHTGSIPGMLGKQIKDFYFTPGNSRAAQALMLAFPAGDLTAAMQQDPEHRHEAIGGAIAGLVGAPFTARLGIPGAFIQKPIQDLGRSLGRRFDPPSYPSSQHLESFGSGELPHPV
jgi:hypothetical protein